MKTYLKVKLWLTKRVLLFRNKNSFFLTQILKKATQFKHAHIQD